MNRAEKHVADEIVRVSEMMGLPAVRVAEWYGSEAKEAAREASRQEAERRAAAEQAETAAWAHQHANLELGLPPDTSAAERMALMNPLGDEPSRRADAPLGSYDRPSRFVTTSGGGLVDIDYQAAQARAGSARRSFTESVEDAQVARHREHTHDGFMLAQRSQYRSRRKAQEAQRAAAAPAAARHSTGLGWPELSR